MGDPDLCELGTRMCQKIKMPRSGTSMNQKSIIPEYIEVLIDGHIFEKYCKVGIHMLGYTSVHIQKMCLAEHATITFTRPYDLSGIHRKFNTRGS
jgi:hypothetical protein